MHGGTLAGARERTRSKGSDPVALNVAAGHDSVVRIAKKLTGNSSDVAREDLAWIVEELANLTPSNLFHEIKQQNQELLRSLHELQQCQEELARLRGPRPAQKAA